jgi:hypothetical protein
MVGDVLLWWERLCKRQCQQKRFHVCVVEEVMSCGIRMRYENKVATSLIKMRTKGGRIHNIVVSFSY